ncbi:MAG: WXG100 family type VII secretion target [Anaerolineae bacterium]|nr:WXG100 family type VII secretion target [Anaerolineae bacterium]
MTDVQMDFDLMEDMARAFKEGSAHLEDLIRALQGIASRLDDGALLGRGGQMFSDAIRDKLNQNIARLQDKLNELNLDVYGALIDLRDGDTEAASRFK